MSDETDSAIKGRRSTDGDWMSVREAYRMFATKEELEKTDRLLNQSVERMNLMPTRGELEARWQSDDDRYKRIEKWLEAVDAKIDQQMTLLSTYQLDVQKNRLPVWFIGVMGIIAPAIFGSAFYFIQSVVPRVAVGGP